MNRQELIDQTKEDYASIVAAFDMIIHKLLVMIFLYNKN